MFGPKIPVSKELMDRLKDVAQQLGYSSAQEFAVDVLEKECDRIEDAYDQDDQEKVEERLRGLGYI